MLKTSAVLLSALALALGGSSAASAHNHAANPSGVCHQSGMGGSPGNSGETNLNPAGKPVGQANAGLLTSRCDEQLILP